MEGAEFQIRDPRESGGGNGVWGRGGQGPSLWPSLWGRGLTFESTQRSRRPLAWTCHEGGQVLGGQEPEAPGLGDLAMLSGEEFDDEL